MSELNATQPQKVAANTSSNQVDGVLQDYLDQLLITATTQAKVQTLEPSAPVVVEEVVEQVVEPTIEPVIAVEETAEETVPAAPAASSINWQDAQGVECLIFKVAGLKLAIPLSVLGGVHPVTDKITPLFGQAHWSLGVWAGDEVKLTIIDSAQLMMPEREVSLRDEGYNFFIQLDRSPWALACQEICDTVTLNHNAIKWRGGTSKRPWLAGTVIDQMCALVDVPETLQLLENQRKR